jgi:hypothetical protein
MSCPVASGFDVLQDVVPRERAMNDPFAAREPAVAPAPVRRPSPEYEFSAKQEAVIASLSNLMHIVGAGTVAFGVLGLLGLLNARGVGGVVILGQAAAMILIGSLTFVIGTRFGRITNTIGADIGHLMEALAGLRTMYLIQVWAFAILIVCLLLLIGLLVLR